jgi:hypothetical protein
MMIDHISLAVIDIQRSKKFYDAVPAPFGISLAESSEWTCVYESGGGGDFSIHQVEERLFILAPYETTAPSTNSGHRIDRRMLSRGDRTWLHCGASCRRRHAMPDHPGDRHRQWISGLLRFLRTSGIGSLTQGKQLPFAHPTFAMRW